MNELYGVQEFNRLRQGANILFHFVWRGGRPVPVPREGRREHRQAEIHEADQFGGERKTWELVNYS